MRMTAEYNSAVTTILARCLLEPAFQRKLSRNPMAALQGSGLNRDLCSSFSQFEFAKLQLFGGLITQTQHNFLWESFPCSRALLKRYGLELTIFGSYRQEAQRNLSRTEKIKQFVSYLNEFLQHTRQRRCYPGLLDVLIHENICWSLQESRKGAGISSGALSVPRGAREFDRLVPSFPENVRVADYRYDPLQLVSANEQRVFVPSSLKLRRTRLFYRMDPTSGNLSVFQAAAFAWPLFLMIDGSRSVGSILRALGSKYSREKMRRYLESAYQGGLVELR